jgi:hypothetical protein
MWRSGKVSSELCRSVTGAPTYYSVCMREHIGPRRTHADPIYTFYTRCVFIGFISYSSHKHDQNSTHLACNTHPRHTFPPYVPLFIEKRIIKLPYCLRLLLLSLSLCLSPSLSYASSAEWIVNRLRLLSNYCLRRLDPIYAPESGTGG